MKLFPLIVFALAASVAAPVLAQDQSSDGYVADAFDEGDWWGLDVDGTGVGSGETMMLANGEAVRTGDQSRVEVFLLYRQPKSNGVIGSRLTVTIDCAAKTQSPQLQTLFYAGKRMRERPSAGSGAAPILPASALYRFACDGKNRYATHYGQGSRTKTAAGAFSLYHH